MLHILTKQFGNTRFMLIYFSHQLKYSINCKWYIVYSKVNGSPKDVLDENFKIFHYQFIFICTHNYCT